MDVDDVMRVGKHYLDCAARPHSPGPDTRTMFSMAVEASEGVPAESMRLIFGGQNLMWTSPISQYGIEDGDVVYKV